MATLLDNTRINRDVQRLMEEVVSHLASVDDAQARISLEVGNPQWFATSHCAYCFRKLPNAKSAVIWV
jgi:hypothetical protein